MRRLARPEIKIVAAGDFMERRIEGVVEVLMNPELRLGYDRVFGYAEALRSSLRLDPDVVMVGGLPDEETARLAVNAALGGRLVLSTIYTVDAASAPHFLAEMGLERAMVAAALGAVIGLRLARRLCPSRRVLPEASAAEAAAFW